MYFHVLLTSSRNYVVISIFGYKAAGYTTLICYCLYAVLHYLMMIRVCRENGLSTRIYNERILLLITTMFLLLGFIFLLLYDYPMLRYIFIALCSIATFFRSKTIKESIRRVVRLNE